MRKVRERRKIHKIFSCNGPALLNWATIDFNLDLVSIMLNCLIIMRVNPVALFRLCIWKCSPGHWTGYYLAVLAVYMNNGNLYTLYRFHLRTRPTTLPGQRSEVCSHLIVHIEPLPAFSPQAKVQSPCRLLLRSVNERAVYITLPEPGWANIHAHCLKIVYTSWWPVASLTE